LTQQTNSFLVQQPLQRLSSGFGPVRIQKHGPWAVWQASASVQLHLKQARAPFIS
jgi:hypothetical protein